jgi:hypothetical protein
LAAAATVLCGLLPAAGAQATAGSGASGTWGQAQALPGFAALSHGEADVAALSCGSPGDCALAGQYDSHTGAEPAFVASEVNGTWQKARPVPGIAALSTHSTDDEVYAVSCTRSGYCVAGGYYRGRAGDEAFLVTAVHGRWGSAQEVPGTAQLNALTRRIGDAAQQLRASGVRLSIWAPDPGSNKVQITLYRYTARQAAELVSRYGAQWVTVQRTRGTVQVGWPSSPRPALADATGRFADESPYWGGDGVWTGGQTEPVCTSGLSWTLNTTGATFTFTAGHCFEAGHYLYTNENDTMNMGMVSTNYLDTTGHYDISSVVGQFGPYVWGNNSASFNVIGSTFPGVGAGVTSDGMATGDVRGVTITKTNAEV